MNSPATPSPDHPRHRRFKPGPAAPTFHVEQMAKRSSVLESDHSSLEWQKAIMDLEQRHADRLAQLEERLAAAERQAADFGGQLNELR
ncbi:MAG TPA: hypothetical protein VK737_06150 [Opitutales bacterium]|jgi:hypothetical protein|nr:hypothetical protein [Opitutales bacterium]